MKDTRVICSIQQSIGYEDKQADDRNEMLLTFILGVIAGGGCLYAAIASGIDIGYLMPVVIVAASACVVFVASRLILNSVWCVLHFGNAKQMPQNGESAAQATETAEYTIDSDEGLARLCNLTAKQTGLTTREREVLGLLARGRDASYVGEAMFISPSTAKSHIYNIYRKTGVHNRQSLIDRIESAPSYEGASECLQKGA